MKSYLSKSKVIILALLAIVGTTIAASALTAKFNNSDRKGISYLGVHDNASVYRLALKNKTDDTYFVSIRNTTGDVIFCDEVNGLNIVQDFKFDNKTYQTGDSLVFTVSDLKGKTVGAYKVDRAEKKVYAVDTTSSL